MTTGDLRTSAVSAGTTIDVPGTAQVGDLLVLADYAGAQSNDATLVTPSGFTTIQSANLTGGGTRGGCVLSAKVAEAGDIGATLTGMAAPGGGATGKALAVFEGAFSSFTASSGGAEATTGNPAAQSVTASGSTPPTLVVGMVGVYNTPAAFSTASPAFTGTLTDSGQTTIFGYRFYASSPANHTIDANDLSAAGDGATALASAYLELAAVIGGGSAIAAIVHHRKQQGMA